MISAENYQSIKDPEELEEDRHIESIYQSLLKDYDEDCGDYRAYQSWCRKRARELASKSMEEESE